MDLKQITPLILTFNEAANIGRTLEKLRWADQVFVLDSFSTDLTKEIALSFPNVRFEERKFDDHANQWNHGASLISQAWVLALDADYVLGDGFEEELASLSESSSISAYSSSFRYLIYGKPLHASLYPPRIVLFRRKDCFFEKDGHTQKLCTSGDTASLHSWIDHDDRKPLSRWFASQDKYAVLEADKLARTSFWHLPLQDRVRATILLAPLIIPIYTLIVRGTLFDGWHGWFYAMQRTLAEIMLSLRLLEKKIGKSM